MYIYVYARERERDLKQNSYAHYSHEEEVLCHPFEYINFLRFPSIKFVENLQWLNMKVQRN